MYAVGSQSSGDTRRESHHKDDETDNFKPGEYSIHIAQVLIQCPDPAAGYPLGLVVVTAQLALSITSGLPRESVHHESMTTSYARIPLTASHSSLITSHVGMFRLEAGPSRMPCQRATPWGAVIGPPSPLNMDAKTCRGPCPGVVTS
jgi:hypothetical protein